MMINYYQQISAKDGRLRWHHLACTILSCRHWRPITVQLSPRFLPKHGGVFFLHLPPALTHVPCLPACIPLSILQRSFFCFPTQANTPGVSSSEALSASREPCETSAASAERSTAEASPM